MNKEKKILKNLKDYYVLGEIVSVENEDYFDLRIEDVNDSFLKFIDLDRKEVVGRTFLEIYPFIFQEKDTLWLNLLEKVILKKKSQQFEIYSIIFEKWIHINIIWMSENEIAIVMSDITHLMKRLTDYKELSQYSLNYLEFEYGSIDYQMLVDNIRELMNAEFAALNIINNKSKMVEVKSVSGMEEKIERVERIIGRRLKGSEVPLNRAIIQSTNDRIFKIYIEEVLEKLHLDESKIDMLKNGLRFEDVWVIRIAHKETQIGSLILFMPPNSKTPDLEILDVYSSQVAILLLRKMAEEEILYLSFHDKLTGLYNRRYLLDAMDRLDTPRNYPISLIMGDANGLKLVNDAFGHQVGDIFLIKVAEILKEVCRKEDILSRIGGDEFVILLPRVGYSEAVKIVQRIEKMCKSNTKLPIKLSIALGIGTKDSQEEHISDILKLAEDRMYSAKLAESKKVKREIIVDLLSRLDHKYPVMKKNSERLIEIGEEFISKLGIDGNIASKYKDFIKAYHLGNAIFLSDGNELREIEFKPKEHVEVGFRIAAASLDYAYIADYILKHHEKWDGSGYPMGIKGREIPLLVRIFSIVEFYVLNKYGDEKLSKEKLIVEFKKNAGKTLDPQLVDIFIEEFVQ